MDIINEYLLRQTDPSVNIFFCLLFFCVLSMWQSVLQPFDIILLQTEVLNLFLVFLQYCIFFSLLSALL